jgi:hypothetical protein
MATSIHADTSWQPPPTAQSGPRHSISGSRRRALTIRRDQQGNRPPGPTSPLEVIVTMPVPGRCRVEGGCKARQKPRESDKCDGISMHSLIMAAARGTGRPVQFAHVRRPTFKIAVLRSRSTVSAACGLPSGHCRVLCGQRCAPGRQRCNPSVPPANLRIVQHRKLHAFRGRDQSGD